MYIFQKSDIEVLRQHHKVLNEHLKTNVHVIQGGGHEAFDLAMICNCSNEFVDILFNLGFEFRGVIKAMRYDKFESVRLIEYLLHRGDSIKETAVEAIRNKNFPLLYIFGLLTAEGDYSILNGYRFRPSCREDFMSCEQILKAMVQLMPFKDTNISLVFMQGYYAFSEFIAEFEGSGLVENQLRIIFDYCGKLFP